MPIASKFDAMKLRTMITEGKTAQQVSYPRQSRGHERQ